MPASRHRQTGRMLPGVLGSAVSSDVILCLEEEHFHPFIVRLANETLQAHVPLPNWLRRYGERPGSHICLVPRDEAFVPQVAIVGGASAGRGGHFWSDGHGLLEEAGLPLRLLGEVNAHRLSLFLTSALTAISLLSAPSLGLYEQLACEGFFGSADICLQLIHAAGHSFLVPRRGRLQVAHLWMSKLLIIQAGRTPRRLKASRQRNQRSFRWLTAMVIKQIDNVTASATKESIDFRKRYLRSQRFSQSLIPTAGFRTSDPTRGTQDLGRSKNVSSRTNAGGRMPQTHRSAKISVEPTRSSTATTAAS